MSGQDMADLMAYDDLCARFYADERMPPGTREVALALAWTLLRDPDRHDQSKGSNLRRTAHLLGRTRAGYWRHKELIAEDAPRYRPPERDTWHTGSCEGPRMRPYRPRGLSEYGKAMHDQQEAGKPLVCGTEGNIRVVERDPVTGWWTTHWFCRRHADQADRVREQVSRLGDPPPPVPNTGGLLACYYDLERVEQLYRWAAPHWEPPYYGICADDWPVPGQQVVPRRPRLSLVVSNLDSEVSA